MYQAERFPEFCAFGNTAQRLQSEFSSHLKFGFIVHTNPYGCCKLIEKKKRRKTKLNKNWRAHLSESLLFSSISLSLSLCFCLCLSLSLSVSVLVSFIVCLCLCLSRSWSLSVSVSVGGSPSLSVDLRLCHCLGLCLCRSQWASVSVSISVSLSVSQFYVLPHTRQSAETITAYNIILTPT